MLPRTKATGLLAVAMVMLTAACSDSNAVGLAFSTRPAPQPILAAPYGGANPQLSVVAAGDSTLVAMGNDTVIIRSVEVVLRRIELKRIEAPGCPDTEVDPDGCEEFESGPLLVSLPLGAGTNKVIEVPILPGTYTKFEATIHKPSASDDAAFLAQHPTFEDVSIRVTGTYSQAGSRSEFVFTSNLDKEQESVLDPPLVISDGGATNVTYRVDISTWFVNQTGTALVDPASANVGGQNEGVVKNNIEQSIEAFKDDNSDGLDDLHEGS